MKKSIKVALLVFMMIISSTLVISQKTHAFGFVNGIKAAAGLVLGYKSVNSAWEWAFGEKNRQVSNYVTRHNNQTNVYHVNTEAVFKNSRQLMALQQRINDTDESIKHLHQQADKNTERILTAIKKLDDRVISVEENILNKIDSKDKKSDLRHLLEAGANSLNQGKDAFVSFVNREMSFIEKTGDKLYTEMFISTMAELIKASYQILDIKDSDPLLMKRQKEILESSAYFGQVIGGLKSSFNLHSKFQELKSKIDLDHYSAQFIYNNTQFMLMLEDLDVDGDDLSKIAAIISNSNKINNQIKKNPKFSRAIKMLKKGETHNRGKSLLDTLLSDKNIKNLNAKDIEAIKAKIAMNFADKRNQIAENLPDKIKSVKQQEDVALCEDILAKIVLKYKPSLLSSLMKITLYKMGWSYIDNFKMYSDDDDMKRTFAKMIDQLNLDQEVKAQRKMALAKIINLDNASDNIVLSDVMDSLIDHQQQKYGKNSDLSPYLLDQYDITAMQLIKQIENDGVLGNQLLKFVKNSIQSNYTKSPEPINEERAKNNIQKLIDQQDSDIKDKLSDLHIKMRETGCYDKYLLGQKCQPNANGTFGDLLISQAPLFNLMNRVIQSDKTTIKDEKLDQYLGKALTSSLSLFSIIKPGNNKNKDIGEVDILPGVNKVIVNFSKFITEGEMYDYLTFHQGSKELFKLGGIEPNSYRIEFEVNDKLPLVIKYRSDHSDDKTDIRIFDIVQIKESSTDKVVVVGGGNITIK